MFYYEMSLDEQFDSAVEQRRQQAEYRGPGNGHWLDGRYADTLNPSPFGLYVQPGTIEFEILIERAMDYVFLEQEAEKVDGPISRRSADPRRVEMALNIAMNERLEDYQRSIAIRFLKETVGLAELSIKEMEKFRAEEVD